MIVLEGKLSVKRRCADSLRQYFEDTTVKSVTGSYDNTLPFNLANMLAALLLGSMLAQSVARAAEVEINTWTDQKIEAAFHDVLAHGELSDIGFLARSLGLDLEVVQWEKPSSMQKQSIETEAMATGVPSYLAPYRMSYSLSRNTKDGTTGIWLSFAIKSCPDLSPWGIDWKQQVKTSESVSTDAGPIFSRQSIRWHQDAEGIVLERTTDSNGSCGFTLTQNKHAALSVPEPPATTPGPGTVLLKQMIDLIVAGDLRDYLTTARILHTEMSTYGKLRGHRLYDGGATPDRIIPGTDTRLFMYFVNDTGWINTNPFVFSRRRGPRSASLWIAVDTVTNCISSESLEALMHQRHIRFRKKSDRNSGPFLRTFQHGNMLSLSYYPQDSCIQEFNLEQETDFVHSSP